MAKPLIEFVGATGPTGPAGAAGAAADTTALQAQINTLAMQIDDLEAQIDALDMRITALEQDEPFEPPVVPDIQTGIPFPPVMAWISAPSDLTPNFDIDLPTGAGDTTDVAVGDVLIVQYSTDDGYNWTSYFTNTLDSGEIAGSALSVTASVLAHGVYVFRSRLERASVPSQWSNYVNVTLENS